MKIGKMSKRKKENKNTHERTKKRMKRKFENKRREGMRKKDTLCEKERR